MIVTKQLRIRCDWCGKEQMVEAVSLFSSSALAVSNESLRQSGWGIDNQKNTERHVCKECADK